MQHAEFSGPQALALNSGRTDQSPRATFINRSYIMKYWSEMARIHRL